MLLSSTNLWAKTRLQTGLHGIYASTWLKWVSDLSPFLFPSEHLYFPAFTGVLSSLSLFLGLLAKPTHGNIIRFAPPLCINDSEVRNCSISSSLHPLLGWKARLHLLHEFSPAVNKFFCYSLITDGWSVGDIKDRPYPQVVTATHLPFHFFITALESASWLMQHTRELTMKERMFSDDLRGPTDTWHPISATPYKCIDKW